ncbi:unnamed protein product [Somion occarium]|uniref:Uncharacterized protein n=1 Tax=Somion occarium TaxID=3059160 RepID=A0ABP1DLJ9_9APHY
MVAQTRTGGQASPKKLQFREKLVGKGLSTDALQKKLKALHKELSEMDQEHVDTKSLSSVRKELINNSILHHKDRGVKAYAACCLADLLRLYAPDAPYTQPELRDIFEFFFRQLSTGLKGSDSPYYNEYFHLLESLSTVKSVVLVCDLPSADTLMPEIFRNIFGIVRHDLARKIEIFMADILIALIDESQSLPDDVLSCLMSQFMEKNAGMDQPAYRLAVSVCRETTDKLQRHVCQYFTDLIVSHSENEDYEQIEKAHELIKQLNRSVPALLHNVVPQLEEELRVEDTQLRIMATQVLGEMFSDKGGADFVKKYPTTWNFWLHRKNDKASLVRLAFVEAVKGVLINLPDMREPIEDALGAKLLDPDEKVRAAVCKLYSQLDYETALHHVSAEQLKAVAGRGLDKKVEAMAAVGRLYSIAYPEIENNDPAAIQHFAWIPQAVLHNAMATPEVKAIAEQVLDEYILPLPQLASADEVAWTDKLLFIMKFLDENAINILLALSGIKTSRPTPYERFLQCCIENNGGVIDENEETITANLNASIKKLAATFPDAHKASDDFQTFAKANENRLYKLLKICMDPQTELKTLIKSFNEFLRRVEQSHSSILSTMTLFLRRSSLRIVNTSSIPTLIKRVHKGSDGNGAAHSQHSHVAHNAQTWLTFISKHYPALYKLHIGELSKGISDEKNARLVEVCLQAMAAVSAWDEKLAPADKKTTERLMRFVMGSNHRHAKFSARLLALSKNHEEVCAEVVESIAESLPEADADQRVAHIAVLSQLALRAPDAFELQSDVITAFLLKKVLMAGNAADPNAMDTDEEWLEDADLTPELRAKIFALKTCRNRCLAHASDENALDIAKPVLKMFTTLIQNSGSFTETAQDDPKIKSRLRLQAAVSLLHLACVHSFAQAISSHFLQLAIILQDPCYQIRMAFLVKLIALLSAQKLPHSYTVIPFLSVHDPEADVKTKAKAFISFAVRSMPKPLRLAAFEMNFVRILHLLAHHPDFAVTSDSLPDIAKYIEFFLELVASADNVSLLFHLAVKLKTVRDSESHAYSENLYAASELAQHLIRARAKQHNWTVESFPGKVKLPGDILRPLPNAEAAKEIVKTVYLPEETLSWLAEKAKPPKHDAKDKTKVPAKRKAASKTNGNAKRPRTKGKKRKTEESSDEESLPSDSEEDEAESDAGRSSVHEPPKSSDDEGEPEEAEPTEERLGRGARTRAKARIKQQAKRSSKSKTKAPASED